MPIVAASSLGMTVMRTLFLRNSRVSRFAAIWRGVLVIVFLGSGSRGEEVGGGSGGEAEAWVGVGKVWKVVDGFLWVLEEVAGKEV